MSPPVLGVAKPGSYANTTCLAEITSGFFMWFALFRIIRFRKREFVMSRPIRSLLTFLVGTLVYLGVPVLSWGPADLRQFFDHPVRFLYVVCVLLLNTIASVRIPEIGKQRGKTNATIRRQHLAVVFLQILGVAIMIVGPFGDRRGFAVFDEEMSLRVTGLLFYVCGFMIMHLAEAALGRLFSMEVGLQENHVLVTQGMYRYLRHPRYLGIMIFMVGISLVFRSWLALIFSGGTIIVLLWRIHDEEGLMLAEFGLEWEEYRRRTWRLVPLLF
jgi:protein-S-isoprenylcysteine O-methyltransferase Ste14